jgi:uncharacterized protein (DUF58 family)
MKKLFLAACFTLALATLGPVSAAATGTIWPLHRHHKDKAPAAAKSEKPAKVKSEKSKKSLFHRQKSQDKAREESARAEAGVSPGPKSVGWRHQTPGPAGAGAR